MHIKPEIRILGIDDSPLVSKKVFLIGTIFRGGKWLDGVLKAEVERDGLDATRQIIMMVKNSKHYPQIRVILLNGVTLAGFNVVDVKKVFKEVKVPVIVVMRSKPDYTAIEAALQNLSKPKLRLAIIKRAGKIYEVKTQPRGLPVYMQCTGIEPEDAEKIVKLASTRSRIPEPLRVAHLIATAITYGESAGRSRA
ncbi:MAG: DUF99 family protein [Methanocellales archaeon]